MANQSKHQLSSTQSNQLLDILKERFEKNEQRHKGIKWENVIEKLKANTAKLWTLHQMETSGGEPDVVVLDGNAGKYCFVDCCAESPKGRRSICYDHVALTARKENKPTDSAMNMAAAMGITLLTEVQYRSLQALGNFDLKTSSWIITPPEIRALGGALFCDRRYNTVFTYHNGADSYYAARGFRGCIEI